MWPLQKSIWPLICHRCLGQAGVKRGSGRALVKLDEVFLSVIPLIVGNCRIGISLPHLGTVLFIVIGTKLT